MPTIFSHAIVPIATGLGLGKIVSKRLIILSAFCSMLPDIDTIGFKLGVPYAADWGHRGATHSIVFALAVALIAGLFAKQLNSKFFITCLMVFLATISHGLLDMCTNGGLGVALYWPISTERLFFDFHPIKVSSIGITNFFTQRSISVLKSEFFWVVLPSIVWLLVLRGLRKQ
jgi:inner membrane protein